MSNTDPVTQVANTSITHRMMCYTVSNTLCGVAVDGGQQGEEALMAERQRGQGLRGVGEEVEGSAVCEAESRRGGGRSRVGACGSKVAYILPGGLWPL